MERERRYSIGEPLSRGRLFDHEPHHHTAIVYAGQSARRRAFLEYAFQPPDYSVLSYPGGYEPEIDDVVSIAREKIHNAKKLVIKDDHVGPNEPIVFIASDIRTRPLRLVNNQPKLESRGKPRTLQEVQSIFGRMSEAYQATKIKPYYVVESGSLIHIDTGRREFAPPPGFWLTSVSLEPQQVKTFASEVGFRSYFAAFEAYYKSPSYEKGLSNGAGIRDLSAGISLPVLVSLGAVTAIQGVPRTDPGFRDELKFALYDVAVGISPKILRYMKPDIIDVIAEWPWLEEATSRALKE